MTTKKIVSYVVAVVILLAIIVIGFLNFAKGTTSQLTSTTPLSQDELIKKGEYLARMGDCVACHTASKGKEFAGGLGIETPIGKIYSSNITPDKVNGIGEYSLQDFDNAVRYGVRKDGKTLYPAMPFPSYARVSNEDIEALYAYFMHGVPAVDAANKDVDIPWPLSMRWPLTGWRMMFAPPVKAFDGSAYQDQTVLRGAYLVQGLGHCGACHTPRNPTMNEQAYDESSKAYLSGANNPVDGWMPINLRGDHMTGLGNMSEQQLVELLTTGRNDKSAVFGGMADVVNHSLQYMTPEDATAMARYLKTLTPANPDEKPFTYSDKEAQNLYHGNDGKVGAAIYVDNCAACHRTTGKGWLAVYPSLAGNPSVNTDNPASLINIVLQGSTVEGTKGAPTPFSMPNFNERLSDQDIADVLTFIRSSWGNEAKPVSASDVKKYRAEMPKEVVPYHTNMIKQ